MTDRTEETAEDLDRSRGILSPTDRKFLAGKIEYAHQQSETDRRREIRHRIQDAILDFSLLAAHLEDKDFDRVFDVEESSSARRRSIGKGVTHALAFLYAGTRDSVPDFQRYLEDGVSIGEEYLTDTPRVVVDVDVDLNIDKQRLDDANVFATAEKLAHHNFDEISKGEMREMFELVATGMRPSPSEGEFSEEQIEDYEQLLDRLESVFRIGFPEGELPLEAAKQAKGESEDEDEHNSTLARRDSLDQAAANIEDQPKAVLRELLSNELISSEEFADEILRRRTDDTH